MGRFSPNVIASFAFAALALASAACIGVQDFGDGARDPDGGPGGDSGATADGGDTSRDGGDGASQRDGGSDAAADLTGTVVIPPGSFTVVWGGLHRQEGATSSARLTHAFAIDAHEVTVAQFDAWRSAGMPAPCPAAGDDCSLEPGGPYADTMRWYPSDDDLVAAPNYLEQNGIGACEGAVTSELNAGDKETYPRGDATLPINCVNFAQAVAVCAFRGMRLPTEVEWYYVASGRNQQQTYPWGNTAPTTCTNAIFATTTAGTNPCQFPKPVGAATGDVSRDGVHDLGGSVAEWVWGTVGTFVPPATLPDDYVGAARKNDTDLVVRGGGFASGAPNLKTSFADRRKTRDGSVKSAYTDVGFRCAKTIF